MYRNTINNPALNPGKLIFDNQVLPILLALLALIINYPLINLAMPTTGYAIALIQSFFNLIFY